MRSALPRGWRDALVALSAAAAGGVIGMAVPIATGHMVDTIIPAHDRDRLVELGLVLVALALASFVMRYVGAIAFTRFEGHAGSQTQAAAMDRLFRLPMTFFRDYSSGDLASRVMALTQARAMVSSAAASAIMGGVFSLFSFGLMFQYSVTLALWATGATLVYLLLTLGFGYARLRQERPLATLRGEGEGLLLQLLAGIAKIRLSASEDRAFARWTANFVEVRRRFVRASLFGALQGALNAVFSLASLFLFINVGKDAVGGQAMIAVGAFAAFLNAFQSFNASATQLAQVAIQLVAIRPLMERMAPILATPVEESKEKDPPGPLSGAVEASGVTFRYGPGQPTVLENVSLSIQSGEFVAFVGPSGSGKSTLTRLILGFEEPESGGILFDGKDLRSLDATAVRRAMGVVPQHPQPMPGSLFENIVGVGEGSLDDAWDAAERAGLAEDIRRMPMGMHTIIPEGGGVLSGGQIQRLMIARVLFNRPRIILLDEATSALDNRTQAIVTESLTRLSVTRIVVAHRLSTVMTADRIHVFEGGRVVETGTYSELMAHGGLFSRLAERQIA
jgi:ATP-binding cassette subfamily C protein